MITAIFFTKCSRIFLVCNKFALDVYVKMTLRAHIFMFIVAMDLVFFRISKLIRFLYALNSASVWQLIDESVGLTNSFAPSNIRRYDP